MKWTVETAEGTVVLSERQLTETLMAHLTMRDKPEAIALSRELLRFLQLTEELAGQSPYQLSYLMFMLGYYYRVFLDKNKVEVAADEPASPSSALESSHQSSGG